MTVTFRKLHPYVGAEVSAIDLRKVHDCATLEQLRAGMDEYGVLVFRDQPFTDAEQIAFAQRFDGQLHAKPGAAAMGANRFNNHALADISNVDNDGRILAADDRKRQYSLANQYWHTDASFQDPAGRYSTLSARVIPPVKANTEFADMRQAYDELADDMKRRLEGLTVHHSIAYSRQLLGFTFSAQEMETLQGAVHPLVRTNPRTGRKSLYLASHANRIMEMPVPEGRLLLADLMLHALQRHLIFSHEWRDGDFVIWDNLATMHRATAFDDAKYRRELRRVTTIDVPLAAAAAA
jgi:alpha-ketoglutarate-dependent 2,4-dichlorophenoxyacetate dioxygenase